MLSVLGFPLHTVHCPPQLLNSSLAGLDEATVCARVLVYQFTHHGYQYQEQDFLQLGTKVNTNLHISTRISFLISDSGDLEKEENLESFVFKICQYAVFSCAATQHVIMYVFCFVCHIHLG